MKKIIAVFSVLVLSFATVNAQETGEPIPSPIAYKDTSTLQRIDSGKVEITISLKAEQHFLIIDYLQDLKSPKMASYVRQVVGQMDTVYNPAKTITVKTESSTVPEIYALLSNQREGITALPNREMKAALLPQVQNFPWIVTQILKLDADNQTLRNERAARAFEYLKSLKK